MTVSWSSLLLYVNCVKRLRAKTLFLDRALHKCWYYYYIASISLLNKWVFIAVFKQASEGADINESGKGVAHTQACMERI